MTVLFTFIRIQNIPKKKYLIPKIMKQENKIDRRKFVKKTALVNFIENNILVSVQTTEAKAPEVIVHDILDDVPESMWDKFLLFLAIFLETLRTV